MIKHPHFSFALQTKQTFVCSFLTRTNHSSDTMLTELLQSILSEIKHYANLQKDAIMQDITNKIIVLTYTLILIFAMGTLTIIAIFYLLFTLAYILDPHLGGLIYSYALITGIIILSGGILYHFRKRLILQPLTKFLTNLFLNDKETPSSSFDSGITIAWGIMGGVRMFKEIIRSFR